MRNNKTSDPHADVEHLYPPASSGEKQIEPFAVRVDIHIHSKRKRLADPDGVCAKAVIDGIVKTGLLQDDSAKEVRNVSYSEEQAKEDETIITLTEV